MVMDIIRLDSTTTQPTELSVGQIVNGLERKTWVERYNTPGEFSFEAPLSSGILNDLPLDSFVSHLNTKEVMMVENHEVSQERDEDPWVTVTGRSLMAYLEQRSIGDQHAAADNYDIPEYAMVSATTAAQIATIINQHLINPTDSTYDIPGVSIINTASGTLTSEERTLEIQSLYQAVETLLKIDDLGIRSFRPTAANPNMYFNVYNGVNRADKVRFSWNAGDLKALQYFASVKKKKTYCRVIGRWVQVVVDLPGFENYNRRGMIIDASDVDQHHDAMLTGTALLWARIVMEARGRAALAANTQLGIASAVVADETNIVYRQDYNLGDLVSVEGDFGTNEIMRVVEYAETEDETGFSSHPTLAIPGGEDE